MRAVFGPANYTSVQASPSHPATPATPSKSETEVGVGEGLGKGRLDGIVQTTIRASDNVFFAPRNVANGLKHSTPKIETVGR